MSLWLKLPLAQHNLHTRGSPWGDSFWTPTLEKVKKEILTIGINEINSSNSKNYNSVFLVLETHTLRCWKAYQSIGKRGQSSACDLMIRQWGVGGGSPLLCKRRNKLFFHREALRIRNLKNEALNYNQTLSKQRKEG